MIRDLNNLLNICGNLFWTLSEVIRFETMMPMIRGNWIKWQMGLPEEMPGMWRPWTDGWHLIRGEESLAEK